MAFLSRPAYASKRPAPRKAAGAPPRLNEEVNWTRNVQPRERYRIVYVDRDGLKSERVIELQKMGDLGGTPYLGVMDKGRFKTLQTHRVVKVLEQITTGHEPSIRSQPTYATELPKFPIENALYKVPTIAAGARTWTVDLNAYSCTCPEKRIRSGFGYTPGRLGFVCPHMARAILDHVPSGTAGWTPELIAFLSDPRRIHIDNLL